MSKPSISVALLGVSGRPLAHAPVRRGGAGAAGRWWPRSAVRFPLPMTRPACRCSHTPKFPTSSTSISSEVGPSSPYASFDLPKVAIYGLQLLSESLDLGQQSLGRWPGQRW